MTPKEKAEELVSNYITSQDKWFLENLVDGLSISHAKQCALIAVKEMTSMLAEINNDQSFNISMYGNYWHEVKQEIENL